jgi:hypothetical protein
MISEDGIRNKNLLIHLLIRSYLRIFFSFSLSFAHATYFNFALFSKNVFYPLQLVFTRVVLINYLCQSFLVLPSLRYHFTAISRLSSFFRHIFISASFTADGIYDLKRFL